MKFNRIYEPVWVNEEKTRINVKIETDEYGVIPFTASPDDITPYGPNIFKSAADGEFGAVAEYIPQLQIISSAMRAKKSALLEMAGREIDALRDVVKYSDSPEQYSDRLESWGKYRAAVYVATPEDAVNIPAPDGENEI